MTPSSSTSTARSSTRCRCTRARGTCSLARRGVPPAGEDFFRRTTGRTGVEVMRELLRRALRAPTLHAFVREQGGDLPRAVRPRVPRSARLHAPSRDAARAAGVKVACATAGDADNIAFALGAPRHATISSTPSSARTTSPAASRDPDLFLLAAQRMGVDPAECLVFEDAPLGIEAARRAGMRAVAIASTLPADELGAPDARDRAGDRLHDARSVRSRRILSPDGRPRALTPELDEHTRTHASAAPRRRREPDHRRAARRSSPRCARGGQAFPNDFRRDALAADLHAAHGGKAQRGARAARRSRVAVAGRMMLKRVMGKACFATLQDMSGRIQLYVTHRRRRRRGARRVQALGPGRHRRRDRARCSRPRPASCRSR